MEKEFCSIGDCPIAVYHHEHPDYPENNLSTITPMENEIKITGLETGKNIKIEICQNKKCAQYNELIPHFKDLYCLPMQNDDEKLDLELEWDELKILLNLYLNDGLDEQIIKTYFLQTIHQAQAERTREIIDMLPKDDVDNPFIGHKSLRTRIEERYL